MGIHNSLISKLYKNPSMNRLYSPGGPTRPRIEAAIWKWINKLIRLPEKQVLKGPL